MKLSANEEYGLRCLVRIGYAGQGGYCYNDGSGFGEFGAGSPGWSATTYYVFPDITDIFSDVGHFFTCLFSRKC